MNAPHGLGLSGNWLAAVGAVAVLLASPVETRADFTSALGKFLQKDLDVITVTDMKPAGRLLPHASPTQPIYYMIINLGMQNFGSAWAGEKIPSSNSALLWMMKAMAGQGYRLADEQHPPTQLFVFAWGMLAGGTSRPALGFLGGDKLNLMWEQEQYGGFVDSRVLLRGLQRIGIAGKVWDVAESNLFLGIVRSYTMDSLHRPKVTPLWETRFACPADGLAMDAALPVLLKTAALQLGRETTLPANVHASPFLNGHVELGEMKVIGTSATGIPPAPARPAEKK